MICKALWQCVPFQWQAEQPSTKQHLRPVRALFTHSSFNARKKTAIDTQWNDLFTQYFQISLHTHALPRQLCTCCSYLFTVEYVTRMLWQTVRFSEYNGWMDGWSSVLRPRQHSIGYMGDGFYRSKDRTDSIKLLKGHIHYTNNRKNTLMRTINTKHNKSPSLQ